jgi:hypothetical protein
MVIGLRLALPEAGTGNGAVFGAGCGFRLGVGFVDAGGCAGAIGFFVAASDFTRWARITSPVG